MFNRLKSAFAKVGKWLRFWFFDITDTDEDPMVHMIREGLCPDCAHEGFYEGPSGGASQNIMCANDACGSRFNVAVWPAPIFYVERISEPMPNAKKAA